MNKKIPVLASFARVGWFEIVQLPLLAYYMAVRRSRDVDQTRNLAKSVTVE